MGEQIFFGTTSLVTYREQQIEAASTEALPQNGSMA